MEESGQPSVILIASATVGGVVLIAIVVSILAACWYRRKRIKQAEEAEKRRRRARRRRSSGGSNNEGDPRGRGVAPMQAAPIGVGLAREGPPIRTISMETDQGDLSDGRTSKRSNNSGKRVTIKEEAIEHRIPTGEERPPQVGHKKVFEPSWRMALVMRNRAGAKKTTRAPEKSQQSIPNNEPLPEDSNAEQTDDGRQYEISATQSETETDKTLTDGQTTDGEPTATDTEASMAPTESEASTVRTNHRLMSSTSDLGDETMSMTSGASSRATTPIKGVLKKPKRMISMDDSLTFSDSTLTNTIENARITGDDRGRGPRRSTRQSGRRSVSPQQQVGAKHPLNKRRSISFDQGPSAASGQHRMFDRGPRYNTMGHQPSSPITVPRPPMQNMIPPGARPRFVPGPPRLVSRPPPGAVIYRHPNHPNLRMAFVPMSQGPRPMMVGRMPAPPPYGYDDPSDWETASQTGSEMDMRKPPRHMMPPPGMMPGYPPRPIYTRMRMPAGGMMGPPRYPGRMGGPRQPRYPPH